MIKTNWLSAINSKFYSYQAWPKANTQEIEYISGRVMSYQRNTKKTMVVTCKIKLNTTTELPLFWSWFNDVLGQTAGSFKCDALGNSYYRFINVPSSEDTDQTYRTLNLELEEVV